MGKLSCQPVDGRYSSRDQNIVWKFDLVGGAGGVILLITVTVMTQGCLCIAILVFCSRIGAGLTSARNKEYSGKKVWIIVMSILMIFLSLVTL